LFSLTAIPTVAGLRGRGACAGALLVRRICSNFSEQIRYLFSLTVIRGAVSCPNSRAKTRRAEARFLPVRVRSISETRTGREELRVRAICSSTRQNSTSKATDVR
jgi:hypothetical protein